MKRFIVAGILSSALLMGCGNANEPEPIPNDDEQGAEEDMGQAAKAEFTSQFLVSTEEEEEGFYRIRGELGGFEMLIPRDAVLGLMFHNIVDKEVEELEFSLIDSQINLSVSLRYQEGFSNDYKNEYLEVFADSLNFEDEYIRTETDRLEIFQGYVENNHNNHGPSHTYFAYIFSKNDHKAIQFNYNVMCINEGECSTEDVGGDSLANKLIKSISFKGVE